MVWYGLVGAGYGTNLLIHGTEGWGGLRAITMLTGKKNNHFELNAGGFLVLDSAWGNGKDGVAFIFPIFNVGYRFQKPEGGFIFRANAGIISLGLSFGYAF